MEETTSHRPRRWGAVAAVAGTAAGTVAAVAAYGSASTVPTVPVSTGSRAPAVVGRPLPAAPPRIVVSTAPCPAHTRLVHGTCVTRVVRTVVVHDPAPAPAAAPTPAAVAVAQTAPLSVQPATASSRRRVDHEDEGHDD